MALFDLFWNSMAFCRLLWQNIDLTGLTLPFLAVIDPNSFGLVLHVIGSVNIFEGKYYSKQLIRSPYDQKALLSKICLVVAQTEIFSPFPILTNVDIETELWPNFINIIYVLFMSISMITNLSHFQMNS